MKKKKQKQNTVYRKYKTKIEDLVHILSWNNSLKSQAQVDNAGLEGSPPAWLLLVRSLLSLSLGNLLRFFQHHFMLYVYLSASY